MAGSNETFNVTIGANMDPSGVLGAVKQMQGAFNGLKLPGNMTGDVLKNFNKLTESLSKFEKLASQDHFNKTDIKSLQKLQKEIDSTFGELKSSFNDLNGQKFYLEADYTKIKEARQVVDELKADIQNKLNSIKIDFTSTKGSTASLGLDTLLNRMEQGVKTSKTLTSAMSEIGNSIRTGNLSAASEQFTQMMSKAKGLKGASAELLDTFKQWGLVDFSGPASNIKSMEERGKLLNQVFEKLVPIFSKDGEAIGQLSKELTSATDKVKDLERIGTEHYNNSISNSINKTEELGNAAKQTGQSAIEMADGMRRASDEVKQLQQSTQYFFSLRNMINLLKRGIREAVDVVKELDAAMTETAVVTDFSVGDMWNKLPEYTANANALGATVKDMYEATTLYYQQGLKTEAAMGIANETMKMARIGGLEAADATDKMTAALRGFNMEINETSAQRVNDVYSNLAAKTASNTEELGTAMQRTASIAASAGMSFEGTAAFLAQAIETTREPAENLGTAMKTIVARFTELKKNPLEITEVDGEEVSYNKVDAALQSIGVSLKDANGQFRDLDKVFLDISQRWDSLTQTQQRYIATTAAGSRQQSRFIAMMSNYERTMQLMDYANNSAGASNEQFGKTMESLEAKLNKLKNAWNEFLMGIMNDSWVKGLVDTGTKILDIVNKIINILSGGGKFKGLKSILSIGTAFTALKAGGNLINKLIGGLGGLVDPTSSFGKGFWGTGKTTEYGTQATGVAGKITTPIVAKLSELIAVTKGQKLQPSEKTSTIDQYKSISNALRSTKNLEFGTARTLLGSLSNEHSYAAYKNAPGTVSAMQQAAFGWLNSKQIPAEAQKTGQQLISAIFKGMNKKEISIKDGMKLLGEPQKWGQHFGTEVAQNFSNAYSKELTAKANERALQSLGLSKTDIADLSVGSEALKDFIKYTDGYKEAFLKARAEIQGENLFDNVQINPTKLEQFANQAGAVGNKFSTAGMSIQMFGSQLAQLSPSLTGVGNLLMRVGTMVSTFGMGISGAATAITGVGKRISAGIALAKATSVGVAATGGEIVSNFIAGVTGGMSAGPIAAIITGVVIGAFALIKGHLDKKAREAGQEVRDQFEEGFTKTSEKIDSLENYRDRFDELSKGVDQFGHNINLSSEEYDEFLSISRELKDLSPSLIAGYNAEGEAILKKGAALDEVIDKLKEEKQLALESYTTDNSIDKLIKEYKTSDAYKDNRKKVYGYDNIISPFNTQLTALNRSNAKINGFDVKDAIEQLSGGAVEDLSNLTTEQLLFVSQHYNDILNLIKEKNGQLDEDVEEGLKNAFGDISGAISDVTTEGQPIIEAMQHWMGLEGLDAAGIKLGDEFANSFTQGFNAIMTQGLTEGWSSEQLKTALRDYSDGWKQLGSDTSEYSEILSQADGIQQQYLDHIGETGALETYKNQIEDSAIALEQLADKQDLSTAAGQAFAAQCIEQANALRNYANEGINLSEALNTASSDIAEAEAALDNFNEATKKDYWTAAEGMKSIYDKATETFKDSFGTEIEKHFEGNGDQTAWEAGRALFGEKALESIDAKALRKKFKEWEPALREGEEGWYNFWQKVTGDEQIQQNLQKLTDAGVELDSSGFLSHIPEDQWANVAEAIGISEEMLTSMLNKGRQFADIDFANWNQVRHSLETSETALKGSSTNEKGQQTLYVKEDSFKNALAEAGFKPEEYAAQMAKAQQEQNIQFIKSADSVKKSDLDRIFKQDLGIQDLPTFIQTLAETGEYTKDEIETYADKLGLIGDLDFDKIYAGIADALNNPELAQQTQELVGISSTVNSILSALVGNNDPEQALQDLKASRAESTKQSEDFALNRIYDEELGKYRNLTDEEYAIHQKYVADLQQSYEDAAADAQAKADAALPGTDERKHWQEVADEANQLASEIKYDREQGEQRRKNRQTWERVEEENAKEQARIQKQANKYLEKYGYGNAGANRQVLDWGWDPTKNNNFKAAQSWDWTAEQLQNQQSTYMSAGLTVGEGKNQVELVVTPMLQTDQGPKVLSKGVTEQYVNELVRQATDGEGHIDTKKLFELDQQGLKIQGQEIHDLLMGSFTGDKARDIADAYGEIAHQTAAATEEQKKYNQEYTKANRQTDTSTGAKPQPAGPPKAPPKQAPAMDYAENKDITYTFHTEDSELTQTEGKINTLSAVASSPFALFIQANYPDLSEALGIIGQVKDAADEGADLSITADTSAADTAATTLTGYAKTYEAKFKASESGLGGIGAKLSGILSKIISINNTPVSPKGAARGLHNHISHKPLPTFASAAKGKGKIGPKNKGGLTLTGEKGFEIAWLPKENRSMIVGAGGPQMLNLPSDAVIYTHEQSKDILKRKGIPAGSLAESNITYDASSSKYAKPSGGSSTGGTTLKTIKDTGKKVEKAATDAAKAVKKVSVWWENIARMTEASQRRMDNNQREFEKYIKDMRATLKTTGESLTLGGGGGDDYIKSIGQTIGYYNSQLKKANQELTQLDTGKWQTGKKKGKKATSKKNKKKKKKTNQVAYEQGADNIVEISYEGKTKKGKKTTKTAYVNTAKYIKTDPNTGEYIVDQKALNSEKNSKKRKAIADAVNKEINDRISKRNAAEDAIRQAQEALEKFGEELYETFFAWEIELTKIWNITQQIEESEARIGRAKNYQSLLESQIANGTVTADENSSNKILSAFTAAIAEEKKNIDLNVKSLGLQKENVQNLLSLNDDKETLKAVQDKLVANANGSQKLNDTEVAGYEKYAAELEKSIDAQAAAWKYMTVKQYDDGTLDIDFDYDNFKEAQTNGEITGDLGKAIQDYVKELTEASKGLNSQYETITSKMVEMNESLKTLQDEWAGYADELWQVSEEQQRKEVDNLKKLSDSITNTLKNLLDDVKRKLDQRRKQEDNAKTEQDISRKQQRLAALQADTSGGHQVEIAQLQQEIADAQQNYQRSLEDQLLENLQQQADIAAQQREQQIALQEATIEAVNNAAQVNAWMNEPEKYKEQIYAAFCAANEYDKKPEALQAQLDQKFAELFTGLSTNKTKQEEVEKSLIAAIDTLKVIEKASENAQQNPTNVANQTSNSVTGSTAAAVAAATPKATTPTTSTPAAQPAAKPAAQPAAKTYPYGKASETSGQIDKGDSGKKVKAIQWALKEMGYKGSNNKALAIDGSFGDNTKHAVKSFQKAMKITVDGVVGNQTRKKFKAKGYKTGGLATQTGPAWLDGTPSKPELVLNAKDTQNFVALKDVLAHVMNGTSDISNSYGDILYEININVDKIEKDYDMDKVVDRVKKEIVKTSGYRNVTQVRNLR